MRIMFSYFSSIQTISLIVRKQKQTLRIPPNAVLSLLLILLKDGVYFLLLILGWAWTYFDH